LDVFFWDERFSTKFAAFDLTMDKTDAFTLRKRRPPRAAVPARHNTGSKKLAGSDSAAAAVILQSFLEEMNRVAASSDARA